MRAVLVLLLCILHAHVNSLPWNGYVIDNTSGIAYKLVHRSQSWPVARDNCDAEGAKLAVPKTKDEFLFIQKLVRGMQYVNVSDTEYKLLVWVGVNNLNDHKKWKTVDGENLEDIGFNTWSTGNGESYSDAVEEPHCAGVDAVNSGLRDYWCHQRQPYICQFTVPS